MQLIELVRQLERLVLEQIQVHTANLLGRAAAKQRAPVLLVMALTAREAKNATAEPDPR